MVCLTPGGQTRSTDVPIETVKVVRVTPRSNNEQRTPSAELSSFRGIFGTSPLKRLVRDWVYTMIVPLTGSANSSLKPGPGEILVTRMLVILIGCSRDVYSYGLWQGGQYSAKSCSLNG